MSVNVVNKSTGALTKVAGNAITEASGINYSHTTSGMSATNVQDAIDESYSSLKNGLTDLTDHVDGSATVYPYADVITINDAVPANLADCSVKVEPVQDLHGYDKPWVGGAGKNKLPLTTAKLKADNYSGTWNGNVYSYRGIDFTITEDNAGNVIEIDVNGTAVADYAKLDILNASITQGSYKLNGISGGSQTTLRFDLAGIGDYKTLSDGELSVDASTDAEYTFSVNVRTSGTTVSHQKVYPMIRLATETDSTFAPYTNICPISGHTEAVVTRDGKNLFDVGTSKSDYTRDCVTGVSGNVLTVNIKANAETFAYRKHNINIKGNVAIFYKSSSADSRMFVRLRKADDSGWMDSSDAAISGMSYNSYFGGWYKENSELSNSISISIPNDCLYWQYGVGYGNAHTTTGANETISEIQIELGSTATPYEPYSGQQYTIALGDTIYGGTVDFDSGVMTVDRAMITLDGTEQGWSTDVTSGGKRRFSNAQLPSLGYTTSAGISAVSNLFKNTRSSDYDLMDNVFILRYINNTNRIDIMTEQFADVTEWTTFLGATNMQVLYMLATPTTIQLTPQQIQLLQGTNTLYASTGQISVTVNGVSGAIGQVQTQANTTDNALVQLAADIAEQLPDAPTTDGTYVLTITVADGAATYSWESAE